MKTIPIATINTVGANKFYIKTGISHQQIKQLINFSKTDKLIKRFTSDPKRFESMQAFKKWQKKKRKIYTLTDKNNNLLGLVWFGKKFFPKNQNLIKKIDTKKYGITLAIRLYHEARGKGIAHIFLAKALKHYKTTQEYKNISSKGIWLGTDKSNLRAKKTYLKLGFAQITKPNHKGRILMVK